MRGGDARKMQTNCEEGFDFRHLAFRIESETNSDAESPADPELAKVASYSPMEFSLEIS